jgi:hypothetical protein
LGSWCNRAGRFDQGPAARAAFNARLRTSETDGFSWFPLPDRLAAGWYVVSLPSATQTIQAIIQVTDVAGYVAISTTKTVVWVNDLASGGRSAERA